MNDTRLGKNCQVVQRFQHRHIYDVPEKDDATSENEEENLSGMSMYQESEPFQSSTPSFAEYRELDVPLTRNDVTPETVDLEAVHHRSTSLTDNIDIFIEDDYYESDETLAEYDDEHETHCNDDFEEESNDI